MIKFMLELDLHDAEELEDVLDTVVNDPDVDEAVGRDIPALTEIHTRIKELIEIFGVPPEERGR